MNQQTYDFIDQTSNLSIKQLLALTFLAIHDDALRQASYEDACNQFILALFDIQRGYNEDNIEADNPICPSGTFNKLIEKLQGIHPDCQIIFVTKQLATLKLPRVVKQVFSEYLKRFPLMDEHGLIGAWNNIEPEIARRMFSEFGSLYESPEHPNFKSFIANGIYVDVSDLLSSSARSLSSISMFCNQSFAQQPLNTPFRSNP